MLKNEQIRKSDREAIKRNSEDYIANRVMVVFALAIVMLWGLTYLWNAYDVAGTFFAAIKANNILIGVSVLGLAGSIAWSVHDMKKGTFKKESFFNGVMFSFFFFVLTCSSLLIKYNYIIAKRVLYVLIPGIAILHLVYCSYQREFFSLAMTHSAIAYIIWIIAKTSNPKLDLLMTVAGIVICGVALIAFFAAKKTKGRLKLGIINMKVFDSRDICPIKVSLIYGLSAVLIAAAYILGAPYAYYILYAVIGFLAVSAVYFTVKLI
ncbi:MAG: hypothetical protein VB078_05125 [Clostridiaceae bacterium]|nr:hypothetical protein [Clostridiaceae bacterium]